MLLKQTCGLLAALGAALLAVAAGAPGCGAKSGLRTSDAGPPDAGPDSPIGLECTTDADCATGDFCTPLVCREARCAAGEPVNCDDNDECTEDSCEPSTGECKVRELSRDEDGDGHKGPRPGFKPGAPGACGDDCDDTSAKAFPGGVELCDGVDNDCNGIVDDDMRFVPAGQQEVLVSSGAHKQAGRGGLVWNESVYGVTYTGEQANWRNYFKGLGRNGSTVIPETPVTNVVGTTFTGPIVWTGAMFGTTWEDRRTEQNYEIWFNRLDAKGNKLGPDVRISDAPGFSLHPSLLWNGSEFLVAWDDTRDQGKRIFGQRIAADGSLLGDNQILTLSAWNAESPSLVEGERTLGMAFNMGPAMGQQVGMRLFAPDLTSPSELIILATDTAVSPVAVFTGDRYVVAWEKKNVVPGDAIWGATVSEDGKIIAPARRLTAGSQFARTAALLSLGDRVVLVWSQYVAGNYELFSKMLSLNLDQLSSEERITQNAGESIGPAAAFGPEGDIGVLFSDTKSGNWQVYFSRLICTAGR